MLNISGMTACYLEICIVSERIFALPASALILDLSKSRDDELPPSYSNSYSSWLMVSFCWLIGSQRTPTLISVVILMLYYSVHQLYSKSNFYVSIILLTHNLHLAFHSHWITLNKRSTVCVIIMFFVRDSFYKIFSWMLHLSVAAFDSNFVLTHDYI